MGINKNSLRFLLLAKKTGVDFSRTAMIGRQTLNMPESHFIEVMSNESGMVEPAESWKHLYEGRYAEKLLKFLGAETAHSFDFSDYEQATFVHDFNAPISGEHKNKYTLVIDGGSLEHIFNFPIAMRNCMEMTAVGGHFISITPSNNNFGHGFYQFSPELFYRVLNADNGFAMKLMYYYDDKFSPNWKSVADPDKVRKRVTLINDKPVMLILLAQRESIKNLFETTPQQSDYQAAWEEGAYGSKNKKNQSGLKGKIKKMLPITFKIWLDRKINSKPNPEFYKDVNIVNLLRS
jgi:hypothetical protein